MVSTRTTGLLALGAALMLLAAACGGGEGGDAYVEPKGPPVATIKLESGNTFFEPDAVDAPPGIINIDLKNIESGIHDLVIRDVPGFQIEVSGQGDEVAKKVDLEPGKYEFYCTIPGHEAAGMKGTLTVS